MSLRTTVVILVSFVLLISVASVSTAQQGDDSTQTLFVITETGAVFGGIPVDFQRDSPQTAAAQVLVDETIKSYILPVTDNHSVTNVTGISFSSWFYLFPTNLITLTNVTYNAQGGSCTRTSDVRIDCTGNITAFSISYDYSYSVPPDNGVLRYRTGFTAYGFTFDGEFNIIYPEDELEYVSAEVEPTEISGNNLTWRKNNTAVITTTVFFNLECILTEYTQSNFVGDTIVSHIDFISSLDIINQYAQQANVHIYITSSFRTTTNVSGAIVLPAKYSNHLVGHAIDMNVLYGQNYSQWCNSQCLRGTNLPAPVKAFIDLIRADPNLRWGGDFSDIDPVHIDDGLNVTSRDLWESIYYKVQANPTCRLNHMPSPFLSTNYQIGKPGSTFTAVGANYPPTSSGTVTVNGIEIGTVSTSMTGEFKFFLQTNSGNSTGYYHLKVDINPNNLNQSSTQNEVSARQRVIFDNNAPSYQKNVDVSGPTYNIPTSIEPLKIVYLPVVTASIVDNPEVGP